MLCTLSYSGRLPESSPNGASEVLKGTNAWEWFCEMRPNPLQMTGLLNLGNIFNYSEILMTRIDLQLTHGRMKLDPI